MALFVEVALLERRLEEHGVVGHGWRCDASVRERTTCKGSTSCSTATTSCQDDGRGVLHAHAAAPVNRHSRTRHAEKL